MWLKETRLSPEIWFICFRKRSYTDTANFTLRCGVCQIGVIGQKVICFVFLILHLVLFHRSQSLNFEIETGSCGTCSSNWSCQLSRIQIREWLIWFFYFYTIPRNKKVNYENDVLNFNVVCQLFKFSLLCNYLLLLSFFS